jgi:hypothetical protein
LIGASTEVFGRVLSAALPRLAERELSPPGVLYRFED